MPCKIKFNDNSWIFFFQSATLGVLNILKWTLHAVDHHIAHTRKQNDPISTTIWDALNCFLIWYGTLTSYILLKHFKTPDAHVMCELLYLQSYSYDKLIISTSSLYGSRSFGAARCSTWISAQITSKWQRSTLCPQQQWCEDNSAWTATNWLNTLDIRRQQNSDQRWRFNACFASRLPGKYSILNSRLLDIAQSH